MQVDPAHESTEEEARNNIVESPEEKDAIHANEEEMEREDAAAVAALLGCEDNVCDTDLCNMDISDIIDMPEYNVAEYFTVAYPK